LGDKVPLKDIFAGIQMRQLLLDFFMFSFIVIAYVKTSYIQYLGNN
jgi:hypothetical protein